jgi:hypothetical protein
MTNGKSITWKKREPKREITRIVLDFFNDLGLALIECKTNNAQFTMMDINPIYVRNMRDIAFEDDDFMGGFNCGTENRVWETLVGKTSGSISYHAYIEEITRRVFENMEGGKWKYTSHNEHLLNLGEQAKKVQAFDKEMAETAGNKDPQAQ